MASQSRVTRDVNRALSQRGTVGGKNPKKLAAKQVLDVLIDAPTVLPEDSVQVVGETDGHDDPTHALAVIIDRQDDEIAAFKQSIIKLDAALTALKSEKDGIRQRNDELMAQVDELQKQLVSHRIVVDARVAEILERHKL